MGFQDAWDSLYNVLIPQDQERVNQALKDAENLAKMSTDNGLDLLNFRIFIRVSDELCKAFQYHLGDLYLGEIEMGVVMLCDYFNCSPFAAVNLWRSKQAVPVFRGNMPYAIRQGSEDIVVKRQLQDEQFTRTFID